MYIRTHLAHIISHAMLQYIVTLRCTSSGYTSNAAIKLHVNSPPTTFATPPCTVCKTETSGSGCEKSGTALIDQFTVECFYFADIHAPLTYEFGFQLATSDDSSTAMITWLSSTHSPSVRFPGLPTGNITVYARVRDAFGATSRLYTDQVQVTSALRRVLNPAPAKTLLSSPRAHARHNFWDSVLDVIRKAVLVGNADDVNKLTAATAFEIHTRSTAGTLDASLGTYVADTLGVYLQESAATRSFQSTEYACAVSAAAHSILRLHPSLISNATLSSLTVLVKNIIFAQTVSSLSTECSRMLMGLLSGLVYVQIHLSDRGSYDSEATARLIADIDASWFRVASLSNSDLLPAETQLVQIKTASLHAGRIRASNLAGSSLYVQIDSACTSSGRAAVSCETSSTSNSDRLRPSLITVTFPETINQLLSLSASDLLDVFVLTNLHVPTVGGAFTPLSASIAVTLSVRGERVQPSDMPITMVVETPLTQPAAPAPFGFSVSYSCVPVGSLR
jgi:hypothetical protein